MTYYSSFRENETFAIGEKSVFRVPYIGVNYKL